MSSCIEAEEKARKIVNIWATGALALGWVPFSSIGLTAAEIKMVLDVAEAFGIKENRADAVLGGIAGSLIGYTASDIALSLIPGIGWLIKSSIAGGVVKALGEAVIKYYKEKSPYCS
jgi:uncharacterized protein (DUF697 family)